MEDNDVLGQTVAKLKEFTKSLTKTHPVLAGLAGAAKVGEALDPVAARKKKQREAAEAVVKGK